MPWTSNRSLPFPLPSPGPDEADAIRHLKADHLQRILAGGLALLLPAAMVITDLVALPGSPMQRGSLSAYYHSGMHDLFVGMMCVIGTLLIVHRLGERSIDNALGIVSGVAAMLVGFFPTGRPPRPRTPLSPIERLFGEQPVTAVHHASAAVMFGTLFALTVLYAIREGRKPPLGRRSPAFWRGYHFGCAGLIVTGGVLTLLANGLHLLDPHTTPLYVECLVIGGFGLSWLGLGLNPHVLRLPGAHAVDQRVPVQHRPAARR